MTVFRVLVRRIKIEFPRGASTCLSFPYLDCSKVGACSTIYHNVRQLLSQTVPKLVAKDDYTSSWRFVSISVSICYSTS